MSPSNTLPGAERGYIIPIGGAEEKFHNPEILDRFIEVCGGKDARIAIIPTASELEDTGRNYEKLFRRIGVKHAQVLQIETRDDCQDSAHSDYIEKSDGVFMTGGNQLRLSAILGGTLVAQKIRRRNAAGVPVAGTSAGASVMSEHMVAGGSSNSAPAEGNITLAPGMGLTNAVIIDQHFTQRNRMGRLLTASSFNPFLIGLGVDEDTAAFIGPDNVLEVVGSGTVTVVDASHLTHSSMWDARRGEALSLLGLRLDVLGEGCRYDLTARQAFPPDEHMAFCTLPD